jgi:hypothetical protein
VKIFFDNCTSPVLASTLNGFVAHLGHSAHHIADLTDLPRGRHSADIEWIELLGKDKHVWMVVTGDGRIQKNKAERAAFRAAGLSGFVLAPAYQKTPMNQVASFLLWRWPEMEQLFNLVTGPALHEQPVHRTSKIRQMPL